MARSITARAVGAWKGAAWGAYALLLGLAFVQRPPCPDVSTFDYMAWVARSGGTLYRDVIEQNWPGAVAFHMLAGALFGNHLAAFRGVDYALCLIGALALARLARDAGPRGADWLVLVFYPLLYTTSDLWVAGQRDALAAQLLSVLGAAHVARMRGGSRAALAIVALSTTATVLIRPTYLTFPALLLIAELARARRSGRPTSRILRDACWVAGLSAVLLGAIVLRAWASGSLRGFWQFAVQFNAQVYARTLGFWEITREQGWLWAAYRGWLPIAALGAWVWWRRAERDALVVALSLVTTAVVSLYVQGKAFGYHLSALLPAMALLMAVAVAEACERLRERGTPLRYAGAALLALLVIGGAARKVQRVLGGPILALAGRQSARELEQSLATGSGLTVYETRRAADYARAHSRPEQTVLVWGRAIAINHLAERRLPTPFASVGVLALTPSSFAPARAWVEDFARTLEVRPPAVVFVPREGGFDPMALPFAEPDAPRAARVLRETLARQYRLDARFGALDAYLPERVP